ncbi:vanadium-dependent haloperoxidase [Salimicrobium halophilum]|uniref:PAP2 superfamily protein n=1 Tax=Salimicrobium halophilum TaxID=86666 RepID=A0A1G8UTV2_9BACI|nr:vanadium-dependent haloperoxidase [Salimicrobium halophilum]SDJ57228.1 hypothetical protein SAMN04490247_2395 [Salimicrobium halophilum]
MTFAKQIVSKWKRRLKAFVIRVKAALFYRNRSLSNHPTNGDETHYQGKIASFSKALPHDSLGEVNVDAYEQYIHILECGEPKDYENLPLAGKRKMVDPQAAYAFEMVGPDSHQLTTPPPAPLASAEMAAEMVEVYWQALTRDIPFDDYDTHPLTIEAAKELSSLEDFRGPKTRDQVTPQTLFRGHLPGTLEGPYVSQFLWKDVPYVATQITQRYRTTTPGIDYLTTYEDWLAIQNGGLPCDPEYDSIPRYIRNGRDLGEYVHHDITVEDGVTACLILLSYGDAAWDKTNPYLDSTTQIGFPTFGAPHVLDFVTKAARPGLEAAWFQKWLVHRRLRPEEVGGRVHNQLLGYADYPLHQDLLCSEAVQRTFDEYGTYLLPQAYPEGSPTHPAYPAGHATFIGAMVTMLKAFFDESFVIPDPVLASSDGRSLVRYEGPDLTVGGELNKLAANIAIGRDAAGVHYRSDGINGLKLGEQVAIGILRDYKETYHEKFNGFSLTTFDGDTIII